MTLLNLPSIQPKADISDTLWALRDDATAKWSPEIRAADEDETTITIYDVIGEDYWTGEGVTPKRISAALRKIGSRDVTVNINSPGGNFFDGVAIFNLLKEHPANVTVRVMGLAASAASVIAMAGDDIEIAETGFLMVHNAWAIIIGNRHDLESEIATLEGFDNTMADLYAKRSGAEVEEAQKWMDDETWFNGKEAIAAGLATDFLPGDKVAEDPEAAINADQIRATLRIDNSLRQTNPNLSRKERQALLNGFKAGKPGAAGTVKPGADDIAAALQGLAQTINS